MQDRGRLCTVGSEAENGVWMTSWNLKFCNFVLQLTLWILFGVQINRHGSNLFDFLVDGSLRFKVPVDVGSLQFLEAGILGGFLDKDLYLHSTDGNVSTIDWSYVTFTVLYAQSRGESSSARAKSLGKTPQTETPDVLSFCRRLFL